MAQANQELATMDHKSLPPHSHRQHGFSLIEVLVAVIIFAVGLLGMLALQTSSTAMGRSANYRLQAFSLAQDMAERIQANATVDAQTVYTAAVLLTPPDCSANPCSPANIASSDIASWNSLIAALPGGTGTITKQAGNRLLITIAWNDINWNGTGRVNDTNSVSISVGGGS